MFVPHQPLPLSFPNNVRVPIAFREGGNNISRGILEVPSSGEEGYGVVASPSPSPFGEGRGGAFLSPSLLGRG
jgi:hypothetical protein